MDFLFCIAEHWFVVTGERSLLKPSFHQSIALLQGAVVCAIAIEASYTRHQQQRSHLHCRSTMSEPLVYVHSKLYHALLSCHSGQNDTTFTVSLLAPGSENQTPPNLYCPKDLHCTLSDYPGGCQLSQVIYLQLLLVFAWWSVPCL